MQKNLYAARRPNGKLGFMTAARSRGLSLLEVMIGVSVVGAIGLGALLFASNYFESWSKPLFNSEEAAMEWAQKLKYTFVASTCTNSPVGTGYVRCAVRVTEQEKPIPLECGVVSKKCSIMQVPGQ